MILFKLIVAFLIGSGLDTALLKIVFSSFVIFEFLVVSKSWKEKIHSGTWCLLIFFLIGTLNSFYQLYLGDYEVINLVNYLLRIRFYFIEILFGVSVYLFFKQRPLEYLLEVLLIALLLNTLVGGVQFLLNPTERIQMLFSEPSAAGFFYCFVIFIAFAKMKQTRDSFIISRLYSIIGVLIFSKGQFLALGLVQIFKASRKIKIILIAAILVSLIFFLDYIRLLGGKFNQIINVYANLVKYGINGLNEKYEVWSSYVTRISAIYLAFTSLFEHPLGLGFGGFNSYYVDWIKYSGVDIVSIETDEIKEGLKYATPRSHILELFSSCGLLAVFLYLKIFIKFFKARKKKTYLYVSFLSLTIVASILELNPFYCYLAILFVLYDKEFNTPNKIIVRY